jgi:16S rRNA (guanine(527)-N(7))-methyltransferase RsmG
VAELVDAQVSEACCSNTVEVRFFSSAPYLKRDAPSKHPFFFAFYAALRETFSLRTEFIQAITANQAAFGLDLGRVQVERLADYYDLIQQHNPVLHLVGPSTAEEFAVRHILESLTLLKHLPQSSKFADVGTGAGLPSIPCLLIRGDLNAALVESKEKKASFLNEAVGVLNIDRRAVVVNRQYAETDLSGCSFVTCRALDKFNDRLPHLLKWSRTVTRLFYGGPGLRDALHKHGARFTEELMPLSEQRYLFFIEAGR